MELTSCIPCHFRESQPGGFIPFENPRSPHDQVDDTSLLSCLKGTGDAVPLFIRLGKLFNEAEVERLDIDQCITDEFVKYGVQVSGRVRRTYAILLLFVLKVIEV